MNKKFVIGVATLAMAGVVGNVLATNAYTGDNDNQQNNVSHWNWSNNMRDAMKKAFENNDYDAWLKLMNGMNSRMKNIINRDNFPEFAQMHRLMWEGNFDEANKIRQELGLPARQGMSGNHRGYMMGGNGRCGDNNR